MGTSPRSFISFHSINIPSEWGLQRCFHLLLLGSSFHSINIPSEWGQIMASGKIKIDNSFHSINIPSEWGQNNILSKRSKSDVSIQLISPASGDGSYVKQIKCVQNSFHSINIPSEWGLLIQTLYRVLKYRFHSINIPSEWGLKDLVTWNNSVLFPFN